LPLPAAAATAVPEPAVASGATPSTPSMQEKKTKKQKSYF
jgi:hypothetical protein